MSGALASAALLSVACWLSAVHAAAQVPVTVPTATRTTSTAPAPAPIQPAPAPVSATAATAPSPAAAAADPAPVLPPAAAPSGVELARRGVVVIERQGRPLALGAVLDGDGRVLTALSPLTSGNFLSVRYADGAVVPLKLAHADRGWDLALLAPAPPPTQALRKAGVKAAREPSFVGLQTFTSAAVGRPLGMAPVSIQLARPLLGGDGVTLHDAYTLSSKAPNVGAPIINAEGEVVAIVARACPAPPAPRDGSASGPQSARTSCVPLPYGAPVSALKQFLRKAPAEATWLGIEAAGDEAQGVRGVRVVAVTPGSPAASAGLRPGKDILAADLIIAVDGTPIATPGELNEAVRARVVGDSIELLLFGLGRYRRVSVKPRPAPELTAPPYTAPIPAKPRTPNPYR